MKIAVGCDHGGIKLKKIIIDTIRSMGSTEVDFGTFDEQSVDYPDYAKKVCLAVINQDVDRGILICGTGIGMSIVANKFKGIRCGHVTDAFSAQMTAEHNNANIIALGARITDEATARLIVKAYLSSSFMAGRHQARLNKITDIENGKYN